MLMYPRLAELREDHDLSQAEMAKILRVSQATYSRYETGRLDIPSQTLIALARYYGVSVDYLLGLDHRAVGGRYPHRPARTKKRPAAFAAGLFDNQHMGFRSGETIRVASVAACTCSTVNSGLISTSSRPLSVTLMTHISVMILVMQWTAV